MKTLDWNPSIHLPEAIALALVFLALAIWLTWRASSQTRRSTRLKLMTLRSVGLGLLALIWLNPGHWLDQTEKSRRDWIVLLDRSASMNAEHAPGISRWQAALTAAQTLKKASGPQGTVHIYPFSTQMEESRGELEAPTTVANGTASDFHRAINSALDQRSLPLTGIVLVSDGRSTVRTPINEVALRARGRGIPIHPLLVGGARGNCDLALSAFPRQISVFKGQPVKFTAQLENLGLGPIKPAIILSGPDGQELNRKEVSLAEGERQVIHFEIPEAPASNAVYSLKTAAWPGEHLLSNNAQSVQVSVLNNKTRVLLLEGAPYWDSKFLAQLLRQQGSMEILTVHRLNEERYFRVEATGAVPIQSPDSIFPANAKELARYDLIVFGKGADGFLTSERIAALQGFVRDQGGSVLFARGKPYAGRFAGLEALEPVEWGDPSPGKFRFTPVAAADTQLFGAALPDVDDRIWSTLPPLEDVHNVARLKPFTRVLAEGTVDGLNARSPLLIVSRFGRGMVATLNADGLWRWDFRPEVRDQTPVYQQFWVQLMLWCSTYSEFRPGQDYAVRLREATTEPGQPIRALITYRGAASPEPKPVLKITRDGQPVGEAATTPLSEGTQEWAAIFTPDQPGFYEVRVTDKNRPDLAQGQASLTALAPPAESDDLRPDPDKLATLARESGGQLFTQVDPLASILWPKESADNPEHKPRWESLWPQWWLALLIASLFGGEWWLRRREGLL